VFWGQVRYLSIILIQGKQAYLVGRRKGWVGSSSVYGSKVWILASQEACKKFVWAWASYFWLMVDYCGRQIICVFHMGLKSQVDHCSIMFKVRFHVVLSKMNCSWQVSKLDNLVTVQHVTMNNIELKSWTKNYIYNTHLWWIWANSKLPLFRGTAGLCEQKKTICGDKLHGNSGSVHTLIVHWHVYNCVKHFCYHVSVNLTVL
jgi:hypothetical protein